MYVHVYVHVHVCVHVHVHVRVHVHVHGQDVGKLTTVQSWDGVSHTRLEARHNGERDIQDEIMKS